MDKLYSWEARRAGGRITIEHSSGKITGIDRIMVESGRTVATRHDGRKFELHVSDAERIG